MTSMTTLSKQAVSELFPPPKRYCALSRNLKQADRFALYEDLKEYRSLLDSAGCSALGHLLLTSYLCLPSRKLFPWFPQARGSQGQLHCLIHRWKLDEHEVARISQLTVSQRDNPAWHLARRGRLTASNFGSVLKAKRVTSSLVKRLLGSMIYQESKQSNEGLTKKKKPLKHSPSKQGKFSGYWYLVWFFWNSWCFTWWHCRW